MVPCFKKHGRQEVINFICTIVEDNVQTLAVEKNVIDSCRTVLNTSVCKTTM